MSEGTDIRSRVLVVDDDPGIRALLEATIGLDPRFDLVGVAGSGAEIHALREQEPDVRIDVVLLDVSLPDGDGIDLLSQLRPSFPGTRFALFTGWSDDDATIDRADAAGADAVFRKDLSPASLLDGIANLVAGATT